jgi:hypothetical protein
VYGPRVIGQYLRLLPAAGVAWPVTEQGNNRDSVAGCIPALSRPDTIANILAVLARLRRTRVAQLSIALAIVLAALLWVYTVERIWFRQGHVRASKITLFAGACDASVAFILLITLTVLMVPIACFVLVQTIILGRQRAETALSSIWLRRIWSTLDLRVPSK